MNLRRPIHNPEETMYETILVPIDESEHSRIAAEHALELAGEVDAAVHFLHVVSMNDASKIDVNRIEHGLLIRDLQEMGRDVIEDVRSGIPTSDVETTASVLIGRPDKQVLEWVQHNDPDLIVMGTRGATGLNRILLGSVAENVARRSSVPVLLV